VKIEELIKAVSEDKDCVVLPATGIPNSPLPPLALPEDLLRFYQMCGGVVLFPQKPYSFQIVPPTEMLPANPILKGEFYREHKSEFDADISSAWFLIARGKDWMECITIDLSDSRRGYCYDSFWDVYATPDSKVVAKTFTELLENLYQGKGLEFYWQANSFNIGTAYTVGR
jgi:antitoxin YokJ